jgi:hypothetical protein
VTTRPQRLEALGLYAARGFHERRYRLIKAVATG